MKKQPYKVLVIPDLHIPNEDKKSLKALETYMADNTWDEVIYLGDFMDFNCISSFNKGQLRKIEGQTVANDYEAGNKILDRHQAIARQNNPKVKFTMLEGNHEFRVERYIDENPQTRGSLEVETGLRLKERGIKFVRCYQRGDVYTIGKAVFHHGKYVNQYHSAKMVQNYGTNIFYGHTHDVQSFSKVLYGKDKTLVGQSLGCLCEYEQSYIQGNPTNWQQAFGVFYFLEDGYFDYFVVRVFKNRFVSPDGKIYGGGP